MTCATTKALLVTFIAGMIFGGQALAMGGGGGDSMPSATAPAYDPAADYVKGVAALNAGAYKDAARALGRVSGADPKNAEVWRLLGRAQTGAANLKGARKSFERAVKLEPDNIEARQGLGVALAGLNDPGARAQLDWLTAKAAACAGTCADAEHLKTAAQAVESALAGAAPAAALDQDRLLFAAPAVGDRAYLAAVSLIHEQRYDAALAALDQAMFAFGPHPDVLTYQGFVWRKKGDYARAETYYRRALSVAPDHKGATEYYGELMVERGDLAGARAMLAKLDRACRFGCAEAEELRRWIDGAPRS